MEEVEEEVEQLMSVDSVVDAAGFSHSYRLQTVTAGAKDPQTQIHHLHLSRAQVEAEPSVQDLHLLLLLLWLLPQHHVTEQEQKEQCTEGCRWCWEWFPSAERKVCEVQVESVAEEAVWVEQV